MFSTLGLQLFTVRDYLTTPTDMDKTFARLAEMGYTEVQTAGYESDEMAKLAKKNGITVVGTHYDIDKILNDPDTTMKIHEILGTKNIGLGYLPDGVRREEKLFRGFIDKCNKLAEIYAKNGYKLTYHNHTFEFAQFPCGKTRFDIMHEEFDKNNISFVLDACWVANSGSDVCDWLEKLSGRVEIFHLKDIKHLLSEDNDWVTKAYPCEIGSGYINWDKVIATAEKTGVKHYVVEQDDFWLDNDPFKSIQISKDYLDKYLTK